MPRVASEVHVYGYGIRESTESVSITIFSQGPATAATGEQRGGR